MFKISGNPYFYKCFVLIEWTPGNMLGVFVNLGEIKVMWTILDRVGSLAETARDGAGWFQELNEVPFFACTLNLFYRRLAKNINLRERHTCEQPLGFAGFKPLSVSRDMAPCGRHI